MGLFEALLLLYMISTTSFARKLLLTTTVKDDGGNIAGKENPPSPPPPPPPPPRTNIAPFKPSIAVVVGVLTTIFSITFLLLLYAKHCKRGQGYSGNSVGRVPPSAARKNSGVDRTIIESLPIFRFGSLRGEKDGLECAVCLNPFEPAEVLKLLPKCKHAFHVECVDTWLDAHSTCPLCRYRVDPEDVLLLGADSKILNQNEPLPPENQRLESVQRVSGRHSSTGERGSSNSNGGSSGFFQIFLHKPVDNNHPLTTTRRSLDSSRETAPRHHSLFTRRSLDSWNTKNKKKTEIASVGCFDRQIRKDELLLTSDSDPHRVEHRIIIGDGRFLQRWSDVLPSDLLYLRSEMIMSQIRGGFGASGSRPSGESGRDAINGRSVSEITGLSRFGEASSNNQHRRREEREEEREAGLVSRWLAWITQSPSQTQTQTAVTAATS
ncbi:RING-H2 finger protein [Actinidia chinensis var. chinensis]|uniref:RING-type E3 ubiquitin transferase n=1 Tax=Actinidia chinensis var. chinensis TaxID=1590841 RepID=A0A2R6Q4I7_ACTCC|nr:RING-H2 finger protein [Actinidia chinensis var. chinensis]